MTNKIAHHGREGALVSTRLWRKENPSSYYILILVIARKGEFSLARQTRALPLSRTIAKSILWHEGQPSSYNLSDCFRFKSRYARSHLSRSLICTLHAPIYSVMYIHINFYKKSSRLWQRLWAALLHKTAVSSLRDFS